MGFLMPKKVVLACKSACAIDAPKVIAEKSMFRGLVDPLVSSKVFRRDETFATEGAELRFGAVPAGVMTTEPLSMLYFIQVLG
jgi:hypothetical protein